MLMTEKYKNFLAKYKVGDTVFDNRTLLAIQNSDPISYKDRRCWVVVAYKGDIPEILTIDEFYNREKKGLLKEIEELRKLMQYNYDTYVADLVTRINELEKHL